MNQTNPTNNDTNCHCDNAKPIITNTPKYGTHTWSNQQFYGNIAIRSTDNCNNIYGQLSPWNRNINASAGNEWDINKGRVKGTK